MKNKAPNISIPHKKVASISDNEGYSPISGSPFGSENNFSFSPEKNRDKRIGLAEALTSRPKHNPTKKVAQKTLTSLYDRAKEISETKEKKNKAIFDSLYTFQPKLNPQSLKMIKIAKKEGKDLHHSKKTDHFNPQPSPDEFLEPKKTVSLQKFIDRNYTHQLAKYEQRKVPQFIPTLDRLDEDCTFKPVLDKRSVEIARSHQNNLYSRAMQKIEEKRKKSQVAQEIRNEKELGECSFVPKILEGNNAKPKINSRSNSHSGTYSRKKEGYGASPFRLSIMECFDN